MASIDLVVNPCRSLCAWRPSRAGAAHPDRARQSGPGGRRLSNVAAELFVCTGCGSQWEPGQPWTPRDVDGEVPEAVRAIRQG